MIHNPTEMELNYMLELNGEVHSLQDEEPDIEEGIDFTKSSWDNELLNNLALEPLKKPVLNQKTMKKLVVPESLQLRRRPGGRLGRPPIL